MPHLLPILAFRLGPLEFSQPIFLLALLLLVPVVYLWKTSRVSGTRLRHGVSLFLRCVLLIAIVCALADTRIVWRNKGICVVFVLDQSQSVPGPTRDAVRERIQAEVEKMTKDDLFCIVEFGGDAVLGSLPSPRGPMPAPAKVADSAHTDIARAIRLATASLPAGHQKRIVLFSDGNQNLEDALREARIAGTKDIDIDTLMLTAARGKEFHEVMVDQVIVPSHVRKDAHFNVRAIISSDIPETVQLLVTRDGEPLKNMQVELRAGSNVVDVPDMLSDGGNHQYQFTLIPDSKIKDNDTFAPNNSGYAFTQVDAPGRILLVRGNTNTSDFLYNALQSLHVPVIQVGTNLLPSNVNDFTPYDCVILDNVNRFEIENTPQLPALDEWVTKFGGGLVIIGGDNAFGPGGYKGTLLEKLAPVEMDVKREKHLASLAIVINEDKSGSMSAPAGGASGRVKLDLANAGAVEALKLLDETDYAMVGHTDTETKWVGGQKLLAMTPANKRSLSSDTLSVRYGGGGIYCSTALTHSYRLIRTTDVKAMSKHVILFADTCDSEQQEGCVALAARNFLNDGITTSCIGLGKETDPDVPFLKQVAAAGHGRFFSTDDANALPKIFLKEAFMVSRPAFIERKDGITPTLYNGSPILEGFLRSGVPKIYGYVGTTLKPRSTLAMHGESAEDPLLAHWSIGLGKCAAYTSDSVPHWGKDWVSWEGYAKFWSQVIRWASRSTQTNGLTTNTVIEGNEGHIIVDALDATGKPINNQQMTATIISPDQTSATKNVPLEQVGPGRYQARFPAGQRGTYLVAIADAKSEGLLATGGGVLSYPPEYRDLQPNAALLRSLTEASSGLFRSSIDGVFQQKPNPVSSYWPLWQLLIIIVSSLLFLDIAWRRLNIADWFRPASKGLPVLTNPAIGDVTSVGAFKTVKTTRREVDTQRQTLRDKIESAATTIPLEPAPGSSPPTAAAIQQAMETAASPQSETPAKDGEKPNYTNRLMSAKKRAADQIRDQEKK